MGWRPLTTLNWAGQLNPVGYRYVSQTMSITIRIKGEVWREGNFLFGFLLTLHLFLLLSDRLPGYHDCCTSAGLTLYWHWYQFGYLIESVFILPYGASVFSDSPSLLGYWVLEQLLELSPRYRLNVDRDLIEMVYWEDALKDKWRELRTTKWTC